MPYCATLYSAQKRLTREECLRDQNKGVERGTSGTNAQYVLWVTPESTARPQARTQEHRKPRRSFVPTRREADAFSPGLLASFPGAVARAQANDSDSPMVERSGRLVG